MPALTYEARHHQPTKFQKKRADQPITDRPHQIPEICHAAQRNTRASAVTVTPIASIAPEQALPIHRTLP